MSSQCILFDCTVDSIFFLHELDQKKREKSLAWYKIETSKHKKCLTLLLLNTTSVALSLNKFVQRNSLIFKTKVVLVAP
jgi:hypothetical protein